MPELFDVIGSSFPRTMKKMSFANHGIGEQKKSVRQPANETIYFCVGMRGMVQCIERGDKKTSEEL